MYATGTLADLADPFVQPRIEREIKQELSSQRLRAALSDPVNIVGGVLALIFCVFAAVAIGLGVVLFGPQSNSPQSNPVRLINAPGSPPIHLHHRIDWPRLHPTITLRAINP